MDDVVPSTASMEDPQVVYDIYCRHNSGLRIQTDTTIQAALISLYPSRSLTSTACDLIAYAKAGNAIATMNEDVHPTLRSWVFEPAARQLSDGRAAGRLTQAIIFGRFDYVWRDHKFQVFVVDGQNNLMGQCDRRCYVLSQPTSEHEKGQAGQEETEALVLAANIWSEEGHDEVWVYDQGRWSKDKELWRTIQSGRWEDIILEESTKRSISRDVLGFFEAKETYAEFGTPWKVSYRGSFLNTHADMHQRGLIFHGSPGNGKTSTAKVLMKALIDRPKPVSTLVVKTLEQRFFGAQMSMRQIFMKARRTAPCLLLFEDVDSLVTDQVRSYFFNEVDGLEDNDGILMIGSTNNCRSPTAQLDLVSMKQVNRIIVDKLDHGLSKRPSRFDRKYCFGNPSFENRVRYCEYWRYFQLHRSCSIFDRLVDLNFRKKLSSKPAAATPTSVPNHIASITDGFSFAYLKEVYISSLLMLVQDSDKECQPTEEDEEDRKWGRFGNLLQQQVASLRGDMIE
jgi:hypothetical protein